jgi:hypothetical protein
VCVRSPIAQQSYTVVVVVRRPAALRAPAREQLTYSMNAFGRSLGSCATDQLSMWYGSGHAVGDASMAVVAVFSW